MFATLFLYWLPMVLLAFVNAALRQLFFKKYADDLRAHQLSTFTLILLCAVYVWIVFPRLHLQSRTQALLTGGVWVVLTVLFEFALGRFTKASWSSMLQDYNVTKGHIWPLFLLCLFLLPYVYYLLRR